MPAAGSDTPCACGWVGCPWRFSMLEDLSQRGDEGRAIVVGVDLGRGHEKQVVEVGTRKEARDRDAGENVSLCKRLDDICRGLSGPNRELVEEALVENLDARHARERVRELHGVGMVDPGQAP